VVNLNDEKTAYDILAKALEIVDKSNKDKFNRTEYLFNVEHIGEIALAASKIKDANKAERLFLGTIKAAKLIRNESDQATALGKIAIASSKISNSSKAEQVLLETIKVFQSTQYRSGRGLFLTRALQSFGPIDNASRKSYQLLFKIVNVDRSTTDQHLSVESLISIAQTYIKINDREKAKQVLTQAVNVAKSIESQWNKVKSLDAIAQAYIKIDDHEEAKQVLSQAVGTAKLVEKSPDSADYTFEKSTILASISKTYMDLNDNERAKAILADAAKSFRSRYSSRSTSELAKTYAEFGNWGEALHLAQRCSDEDKVAVFSHILRVHAEQENPEFKALRDLKPDEAED
jgi:tetratricopeptide (TPR) repeat protein